MDQVDGHTAPDREALVQLMRDLLRRVSNLEEWVADLADDVADLLADEGGAA